MSVQIFVSILIRRKKENMRKKSNYFLENTGKSNYSTHKHTQIDVVSFELYKYIY